MSEFKDNEVAKANHLVLVDTSSFLYRAFHALPDLRSDVGFPTGAITGIVTMLKKVSYQAPADFCVCVFDPVGKTFRDEIFSSYKANRSSMPSDLAVQIPVIFNLIQALGWPIIQKDGYEADDVIGSLVRSAESVSLVSTIISGDKDLAQLVNSKTRMIDTMSRGSSGITIVDEAAVIKKYGVQPSEMVDFLTLVGDPVDNIPGVPKVGPKTASRLISTFGSLTNIIENIDKIPGVIGENLRTSKDWLPIGKSLVSIKTDLDLEVSSKKCFDKFKKQELNLDVLLKLKEKYSLNNVLNSIFQDSKNVAEESKTKFSSPPIVPLIEAKYKTICTAKDFEWLLVKIMNSDATAFDTETTSLNVRHAELVGLSFSWARGEAAYIPLGHKNSSLKQLNLENVLKGLTSWFELSSVKIAHNLKYDRHVLANYGVSLKGSLHDTLLQSYILEAHLRRDLGSLASRHLNRVGTSYEQLVGKGSKQICFSQVPIDLAANYSCEDSDFTLHLHENLLEKLTQKNLLKVYSELEIPCLSVLYAMERHGICVDKKLLTLQTKELSKKILELEKAAHALVGEDFNLGSPKQLRAILFEKFGYNSIKKTASGVPSTDESVLEKLAEDYPLPKLLLDWRTFSKLKTTYTEKLPKMIDIDSGRVYTTFSQAVVVTGRLASSDPNLQNIPIKTAEGRRIRAAFKAPTSRKIVAVDYSQIELRIMAHLSEDVALIRAFKSGKDVHSQTAAEIFGIKTDAVSYDQRRTAKVINFGLIYGMSAFGLAKSLNISRGGCRGLH